MPSSQEYNPLMAIYNLTRNIQFIYENDSFNKNVTKSRDLSELPSQQLIVSEIFEDSKIRQIKPTQVNDYLGQEVNNLFYDAVNSFDVNHFVAIVGCLVGGGTLVLRLPNFYKNIIRSSKHIDFIGFNNFQLPAHKNTSQLLLRFIQTVILVKKPNFNIEENNVKGQCEQFYIEQNDLIRKIERCSLGHAKRPLVITADRGRGKSTALAKASASLCYLHNKNIIITAPRRGNLNIFFSAFKQELEKLKNRYVINEAIDTTIAAKERLKFIAIDQLTQTCFNNELLIIDEAGSFPVQILANVIKKFNRVVFASTISGYEGNGRGFEIKFFPILQSYFPQYRTKKLTIPFRWRIDDILEGCCNKAFLMGQSNIKLTASKPLTTESFTTVSSTTSVIEYEIVSKKELLNNEKLLSAIFTLLTEAHYQTRPSDLERILVDPMLKVYVGKNSEEQIICVSLVIEEGKINKSDALKISEGKLRLKGHLLPQSLISTKGIIESGQLLYWRIMRIAVAHNKQNSSIGSGMVQYIRKQTNEHNVDILGTSFALNSPLFNFWNLLEFNCCRIALRTDSSTGLIPADFLLPISNKGKSCSHFAINQFNQSFIYSSSASYKNLDSKLLSSIMSRQVAQQLEDIDTINIQAIKDEIANYISQARSYEMVEWQIFILVHYYLTRFSKDAKNKIDNCSFVFAKVFQKHSWAELVEKFELDGKKEAQSQLKKYIHQIYEIVAGQY